MGIARTSYCKRMVELVGVELVGVELVGVELVGVELVGVELVGVGKWVGQCHPTVLQAAYCQRTPPVSHLFSNTSVVLRNSAIERLKNLLLQ